MVELTITDKAAENVKKILKEKGAEIDYVDDIMKSGFTIFNPNAVKSCACGSSFDTADSAGKAQAHACH